MFHEQVIIFSINKVSKFVGPGGVFVSIAKTLASARVSIDMVAGPTELVVYANAVIKGLY
jgi:histidinol dehydrogenase